VGGEERGGGRGPVDLSRARTRARAKILLADERHVVELSPRPRPGPRNGLEGP